MTTSGTSGPRTRRPNRSGSKLVKVYQMLPSENVLLSVDKEIPVGLSLECQKLWQVGSVSIERH